MPATRQKNAGCAWALLIVTVLVVGGIGLVSLQGFEAWHRSAVMDAQSAAAANHSQTVGFERGMLLLFGAPLGGGVLGAAVARAADRRHVLLGTAVGAAVTVAALIVVTFYIALANMKIVY